jgi:hypothetical protein
LASMVAYTLTNATIMLGAILNCPLSPEGGSEDRPAVIGIL